jgi:ABC-type sugar transport system ATPase subunit
MVEIAKALSLNPRILILDEPTSSITHKEIATLFEIIRKMTLQGIAVIYITHKISEVFQIADKVSILKDGQHTGTDRVAHIDQNWIIKRMIGRDVYFHFAERSVSDEVVLDCRDFSDERHFWNVSFNLRKKEILSFAGLTGAGRTELFKSIIGAIPKTRGELYLEDRRIRISSPIDALAMGLAYLPEDRKEDGLFLDMDVRMNVVSASMKTFQKGLNVDERMVDKVTRQYVEELSINTPSIKQQVVYLSGGNQQKVIIAKWIITNPKVLIVDEPTRGVDVGVKTEIYKILRNLTEKGTSIIVISSDLPEVLSISDRVYVMYRGVLTGELLRRDATEENIMMLASGIGITTEPIGRS